VTEEDEERVLKQTLSLLKADKASKGRAAVHEKIEDRR
jgi:hypothetical protein